MNTESVGWSWGLALGLCAFLGGVAFAGDVYLGERAFHDITVSNGETRSLDGVVFSSEATINKMGKGTLNASLADFVAAAPSTLAVREGTLQVAVDGVTVPAPEQPLGILNRAAFWVDASVNVQTAGGGVTRWLDVRETNLEAPTRLYGQSMTNFTNALPQVVSKTNNGKTIPAVNFGGYASGQWMEWHTNGVRCLITNTRHVFAVWGIESYVGFIFGSKSGEGYPSFHVASYGKTNGSTFSPWWAVSADTTLAFASTYHNGRHIDGFTEPVTAGWHVLDVAQKVPQTTAVRTSCFFNNNDHHADSAGYRVGGDNVGEVLVFTNDLTDVERMTVERYLMAKWGVAPEDHALTVGVARGATVAMDVSSGTLTSDIALEGEGTLQKTGSGQLVLKDVADVDYTGTLDLQAGRVDCRRPTTVAATPGRRVTVAGTILSKVDDAGAATFTKEGDGLVVVREIPSDLKTVNVNAGTLVVRAAFDDSASVATNAYGHIPDPSFETTQIRTLGETGAKRYVGPSENWNGWTNRVSNGFYIFNVTNATDSIGWCRPPMVDGAQCLGVKDQGSACTTLTVPADGVYDITFWTNGRKGYGAHLLNACLDGIPFATVHGLYGPWFQERIRTPWLTAGDHVLSFEVMTGAGDRCLDFDLFEVRLVSTKKSDGTILLPNGDFELTNYSSVSFNTSNVATGWTGNGSAAPIRFNGTLSEDWLESPRYGNVVYLIKKGGTVETTCTLPAGTYRLQTDLARREMLNKMDTNLKAELVRSTSAVETLGEICITGSILLPSTWANAFSVAEGESVTFRFTSTGTVPLFLDNVAVVPQVGENLIANGGFESIIANSILPSDWTFSSTNGTHTASRCVDYSDINYNYCPLKGARRLKLCKQAIVSQEVAFPTTGVYRLVFHAMARLYGYGPNPIRAWIAQGGVTNVIGSTPAVDSDFVKYEWLFRAQQGTATFAFEGQSPTAADRSALIDEVSIEHVDFATEDSVMPESTALNVAEGACLRLDFPGTNRVDRVRLGGRTVVGVIDETTYPEYVKGPGALFVQAKGTLVILK